MAIITGNSAEVLQTLEPGSVRCCVTSPPYWGLRDYGVPGQIGMEKTPDEYVSSLVSVFSAVRRALSDDGTLWVNLGDSYYNLRTWKAGGQIGQAFHGRKMHGQPETGVCGAPNRAQRMNIPQKSLVGIPWRVALALQADGWVLRSDIIWHKPNPTPESVKDRPTKSHEYVFMFSKSQRYYWDQDAVREPSGSNARSVWSVATQSYPGSHFAVMPEQLAGRCIRAGSQIGDVILDPFSGAGTTGVMAHRLQRKYIGIELSDSFSEMARRRIEDDQPLFNR
jgi:site-specific DNA-methyltransferase (cytosine-N4-specific)